MANTRRPDRRADTSRPDAPRPGGRRRAEPARHAARRNGAGRMDAEDRTRRRVRHLLPALLGVTVAYPVTLLHPAAAAAYALLYLTLLALGARVAGVTPRRKQAAVIVACVIVALSVPRVLVPHLLWLEVTEWTLLLVFHVLVFLAIFEYLLEQHEVDRDVIFAGTSLYVLVGDMFVPAAMVVHLLSDRFWATAAYNIPKPVRWQDLVYFSFSTLTSLGYGDVLPRNSAARSLAIAESVLGVLVVALIIGRLVGSAAGKRRWERERGR